MLWDFAPRFESDCSLAEVVPGTGVQAGATSVDPFHSGTDLHRRQLRPRIERWAKGDGAHHVDLIGIIPATYALNLDASEKSVAELELAARKTMAMLDLAGNGKSMENEQAKDELSAFLKTSGHFNDNIFPALATIDRDIANRLNGRKTFADVPKEERPALRSDLYLNMFNDSIS